MLQVFLQLGAPTPLSREIKENRPLLTAGTENYEVSQ